MIFERWGQLNEYEQLGNIGSAFLRASKNATSYDETLELLDLTIADKRWRNRTRELLRLRELICGLMIGSSEYRVTAENLNRYFLGFAIAARR